MSDQPTGNNNNNSPRPPGNNPNNSRRHNNQRRRPQGPNANQGQNPNPNQNPNQNNNNNRPPNAQAGAGGANPGSGGGQRRRPNRNNNNRPRNPNQNQPRDNNNNQPNGPQGLNVERIYEKYLNLLDQHLIARRKYHDLFYRADPAQKNKLERNFYNTLNDIRDFEARLAPEARVLFEKRNNGLAQDNIYTSNHELPLVGDTPPPATEWADPHFLQSQQAVNFVEDKEESVGSAEDYLKYKNLI